MEQWGERNQLRSLLWRGNDTHGHSTLQIWVGFYKVWWNLSKHQIGWNADVFWFTVLLTKKYTCLIFIMILKEKLSQAFMQIGWMEDDFRNLTAKVWANLDNPIKRYDFSKVHYFCVCRPLRWHSSNICDVTTVQLSNGTVHNFFTKFHFSWKCIFPLLLYLGMLGLRWMCMHLWMNLIKRTIDIQEQLKNCANLCTKSMESCPLVISHILAEFHPERATYTTLHNHFS